MRSADPTNEAGGSWRRYCFGEFTLDLDGGFLRRGDDEVTLSPKAFDLLVILVQCHGRLVSKASLIEAVWPDTAITDNSLAQRLLEIRRALGDDSQQMIRTVARRGYLFATPVTSSVVEFPRHPAEISRAPIPADMRSLHRDIVADSVTNPEAERQASTNGAGTKRAHSWRTGSTFVLVAVASVAIIVAGVLFLLRDASNVRSPPSTPTASVAVLPFINLTGDKEQDHLWSEKYERPVSTAFASQEAIALGVLGVLGVQSAAGKPPPRSVRVDSEAYDLYIRGVLSRGREGTAAAAINYFEQAVSKDPEFARAYAGMAGAYLSLAIGSDARPADVLPKAKEMLGKALSIDPSLPEAYVSQAVIARHERNWPAVERSWRRAIELYPNLPRHDYALHLADMGRPAEALAEVARLRSVDPLAETDHYGLEAKIFYFDRKYDLALDRCQKALAASPDNWEVLYWLGRVRASQSLWAEALEALEKSRGLRDHYRGLGSGMLGAAYVYAGRRSQGQKVLEQLKEAARQKKASPLSLAHIYVSLGDADQAFEWLNRAENDNDSGLATLRVEPAFDPIRSDPRFIDLLQRVHLAQ